ncbi:hypothetical protein ACG2OD_14425 [Streptomyces sp. PDY-4]|uniref:hypothetical protein n=1 Tax=Streptomyces sp. PDY-4 TaxID=3376070 RepID=UPI0037AD000C
MSYALTDAQVMSTLREIVSESPDKVYEAPESMADEYGGCFYVHNNDDGTKSAGCIVGQVLHRLGVSLEDLSKGETYSANAAVALAGVQGVSEDVVYFLRMVQSRQDRGTPWGEALQFAEEYYADKGSAAVLRPEAVA